MVFVYHTVDMVVWLLVEDTQMDTIVVYYLDTQNMVEHGSKLNMMFEVEQLLFVDKVHKMAE
jgi:hypothetical protein